MECRYIGRRCANANCLFVMKYYLCPRFQQLQDQDIVVAVQNCLDLGYGSEDSDFIADFGFGEYVLPRAKVRAELEKKLEDETRNKT